MPIISRFTKIFESGIASHNTDAKVANITLHALFGRVYLNSFNVVIKRIMTITPNGQNIYDIAVNAIIAGIGTALIAFANAIYNANSKA